MPNKLDTRSRKNLAVEYITGLDRDTYSGRLEWRETRDQTASENDSVYIGVYTRTDSDCSIDAKTTSVKLMVPRTGAGCFVTITMYDGDNMLMTFGFSSNFTGRVGECLANLVKRVKKACGMHPNMPDIEENTQGCDSCLKSDEFNKSLYDHLIDSARAGKWSIVELPINTHLCEFVERVGSCSDDLATAIHTLIRDDSGTYTYRMNVRVSSSASRVEYTNHGFSREKLHDMYTIITATVHISNNAALVEYYNRVLKNSGKDN